jgi:hypothetical protein
MQGALGETMKSTATAAMACIFAGLTASAAEAATYTYTNGLYTTASPHTAGDCTPVGGCTDYTLTESVTGSFTTAVPLAANLSLAPATPLSYSFSDGVNTIADSQAGARIAEFDVSTDNAGNVTSAQIFLEAWRDGGGPVPPHAQTTANSTQANARLNAIVITSSGAAGDNDLFCQAYGPVPPPATPDTCSGGVGDTFSSAAGSTTPGMWVSSGLFPVPTLSETMVALFAVLLGSVGLASVRRRRGIRV